MKKFLQFAGLIGAVLAIIAFILMMATNAIVSTGAINGYYGGTAVIFGKGPVSAAGLSGDFDGKLAWVALISWIFVLISILMLLCLFVLGLLKVKAVAKFERLLTFIAGGLLIAGGILLFFSIPAFFAANDLGDPNDAKVALGAGWVIAAIIQIVAGGIAILPPVLSLVGKK